MAKSARDLDTALQHLMRGELNEAEVIYRRVLEKEPRNPDAYHFLGIAAYQSGRFPEAVDLITRAVAIDRSNPAFFCNLGLAYAGLRDYESAVTQYREALRIHAPYPEAHNNLGNAYKELGRFEEAVEAYRKALSLAPGSPETLYNLGAICQEEGKADEAMECYEKALVLLPGSPEIYNNLSVLYKDMKEYEKAVEYAARAIELSPGYPEAYLNLALTFKTVGLIEHAITYYDQALAISPGSIEAMWGKCMAQVPILYDSEDQIRICRNNYRDSLHELDGAIELDTSRKIDVASRQVGATQPFYLPYQGRVDKVLQSAYGNLVCRIQQARYPDLAGTGRNGRPRVDGRIRVGIVSGFFYYHSNWKMPIKGWVENIDKSRFALFGYYTGKARDDETAAAKASFDRFVEGVHSFAAMSEAIRGDDLDILIYPEIGMDPMTVQLAAIRLAPIQCTSWGHPNTSGLPTIDYYLSSDLMEPEDGDNHYTETLVRLPNLSIHYTPIHGDGSSFRREDFGLNPDSVVYFCAQSLFKYLPQYDDIFPRIAAEVGNSQFAFIGDTKAQALTDRFVRRLGKAFEKHSLANADRLVILPRLDKARYHAMNALSDVFLDSIGWSGCNSTLEAIECDLPVVSLPGNLMRGRHTYAILTMMGVDETIAENLDDYVDCAVKLGKDKSMRDRVRAAFRANKQRLYYDMECVKGFESFLEDAVRGRLS